MLLLCCNRLSHQLLCQYVKVKKIKCIKKKKKKTCKRKPPFGKLKCRSLLCPRRKFEK